MTPHSSPSSAQVWFRRSMALTVALGALVVLLVAARPGYAGFFVASTLAFVVAGFLWVGGDPPERGHRVRGAAPARALPGGLSLARSYRITLSH
jgi:hypothetical protein